jgi:hypothetical protein
MAMKNTPKKLYKTMQGRLVDIDRLRAANEMVPAIGNMRVNARGDVLGNGGKVVKTKEQKMQEYYQTPAGQVSDVKHRVQPAQDNTPKALSQQQLSNANNVAQQAPQGKKIDLFKPKKGIDAALDGIE